MIRKFCCDTDCLSLSRTKRQQKKTQNLEFEILEIGYSLAAEYEIIYIACTKQILKDKTCRYFSLNRFFLLRYGKSYLSLGPDPSKDSSYQRSRAQFCQ